MNDLFQQIANYLIEPNMVILGAFIFLISFVISNKMIPIIIYIVQYKKLMDHPNERSSHCEITPTLAGVAFFGSTVISIFFIQNYDESGISLNIIASLTILFFIGLKDDLIALSSKMKVILQSIAIFFILIRPEFQIVNFHGFFHLFEMPLWFIIPFSYFVVLYIINAYNLIDGIDGLAGILGILISVIFSILFFSINLYFYGLIAVVIVGFLIAFLRFNLSKKNKIFMGDTGSMIVGFLFSLLFLRFLSLDVAVFHKLNVSPQNFIIVAISIMFFPIIDVIRVIFVRIVNGKGPFSADRRHMHHVFIDKGLPHIDATITFTISNVFTFLIIYFINSYLSYISLLILFIFVSFLTFYLLMLLDSNPSARTKRKKLKTFIPEKIYLIEFRIRKGIIVFLKNVFYKNML